MNKRDLFTLVLGSTGKTGSRVVAGLINRVNLEDVFCQIKTDCCNIAHGWLPLLVIFDDHHPGTSMPSGGHPPHQLAASFILNIAHWHISDMPPQSPHVCYQGVNGPSSDVPLLPPTRDICTTTGA